MTTTYGFDVSSSEFAAKRVLVTGGAKGGGQAIVRRFQTSGDRVVAKRAMIKRFGFPDVLSVENVIRDLLESRTARYLEFVWRCHFWCEEMFRGMSGHLAGVKA
ncbi:MAG TPA: hypothetical protein VGN12_09395 [Pirellulales bacterium]|jgi:hypothetical protein